MLAFAGVTATKSLVLSLANHTLSPMLSTVWFCVQQQQRQRRRRRRRHQLKSWPHLYELYRYGRFSNTAATDDNQFIRLHLHFNTLWWLNYYFYSSAVREKNSTRNTPMYRHNRLNDKQISISFKILLDYKSLRVRTHLNDTIAINLSKANHVLLYLFNKLDLN